MAFSMYSTQPLAVRTTPMTNEETVQVIDVVLGWLAALAAVNVLVFGAYGVAYVALALQ